MQNTDQRLTKLEQLLKMIDDSLTREEFVKAFENVVQSIQIAKDQMRKENSDQLARQQAMIEAKLSSVKDGVDGKDGQDGVDGKDGADGVDGQDGIDGESVDETKIANNVLKQIDLTPLFDKLDQKLSELDGKIKAIPERPVTTIFGPGKTKIFRVDLSSQLDGATKTFKLGTHFGILSVDSSSAPFGAFRETVDYKESGRNIVFTANVDAPSALAQGQSLIVKILK